MMAARCPASAATERQPVIAAFLAGSLLGLVIALPIGPVALACIRSTLRDGPWAGAASGLGGAGAHAIFAMLAGLGAAPLAALLTAWQAPIAIGSALLLCTLGLARLMRGTPPPAGSAGPRHGWLWLTTLLLALANPMTALPYLAAGPHLAQIAGAADPARVFAMAAGAASGALGCYLAVAAAAAVSRRRVGPAGLAMLETISGLALVGFGLLLAGAHV